MWLLEMDLVEIEMGMRTDLAVIWNVESLSGSREESSQLNS